MMTTPHFKIDGSETSVPLGVCCSEVPSGRVLSLSNVGGAGGEVPCGRLSVGGAGAEVPCGRLSVGGVGASEGGFTLLEVIVAIALLAIGMIVILDVQGGGIQMTRYARDLTVATQLARARMAKLMQEIEDKKVSFGVSSSNCQEGDFDDLDRAFRKFKWRYCIKKVEIAIPTQIPGFSPPAGDEKDGEKKEESSLQQTASLMSALGIPLKGNSLSTIASSLGPFFGGFQTYMKAMFKSLQDSLREIEVVVSWEQDGRKRKVTVTTHLFHFDSLTGLPTAPPEPKIPGQN